LDLRFTLMGTKSVVSRSGVHWWSTATPEGTALVAFTQRRADIRADAWGPGTDWALTQLPDLLGAGDDGAVDFHTDDPKVQALTERFGSLRLGATNRWYEALAMGAIGQRVVTTDAKASRRALAVRFGDRSLGGPLAAFPTPGQLLRVTDHDFHRVGIERSRARVLRVAAKHADRLERLGSAESLANGVDANEWVQRLPGVGPWTAALATSIAGGDADAVPVGDLHIPRIVTYALTGQENGDDATMLEALKPFAGHRHRVVRMIKMSDVGPANHRPAPFRYDISAI
jgi:3-methyladenine DNA glycosylase/8-oxoguanine DNA glycosylase